MKKIRLMSLVLAALLLSGCAREKPAHVPTGNGLTWEDETAPTASVSQEEPQQIVMAYYPEMSLNPYQSTDCTNRALFSLLYQSLFVADRDYRVSPVLCQRYTVSEDMKNYTFYVAPDARFSDGERVTAEDVTASLLAAMSGGYYAGRFSHVSGISTTADGGVYIRLDCAYEDLPRLLDIPIVKKEQVNDPSPLGSGPYILRTAGSQAALYRNNDWWCHVTFTIRADTIPLRAAGDPVDIRNQFEFSDVSLVCTDPGSNSYADYRCDYELWDCENAIFVYLGCNMESTVFSNPQVRSALTYAIDRDALVEDYYRGFAMSAVLPASPLSPYYDGNLAAQYTLQKEKFTQAVTQAGLQGAEVRLLTNSDDTARRRAARAIGDTLASCGLKVTMEERNTEDYINALRNREYDLYLGQTRLPPNMDLTEFFYEDGKLSFGPMDDTAIYNLCLKALENSGNYYDLYQAILADGRLCPVLFRSYAVYASRGSMSDLAPARDNLFYYDLGRTLEDARTEQANAPQTTTPETTVTPETTNAPETTGD